MNASKNDPRALFNIGYGLYVITSNNGVKDNGMICNAVTQVTSNPARVSVTINKDSYSHGVIKESGVMNINCLSVEAPFRVFEVFGFKSGKDTDKFEGCEPRRSDNGLVVLPKYINSYISLSVEQYIDLDTHGMFICRVTAAEVISEKETMAYSYYHKNVKPAKKPEAKKGYVCTVCGYIHEGELTDDFVCPLCHHGKEAFEEIKS